MDIREGIPGGLNQPTELWCECAEESKYEDATQAQLSRI